MTCREKLELEHPEYVSNAYAGGCKGCPDDYGYLPQPKDCSIHNCRVCWDREIPTANDESVRNPQPEWDKIYKIIEDAVEKRDRSVSIYFNPEVGMSVSVYPWPDAEELYDMYQKSRITVNDFRLKMGLPLVKNAEQIMKRDFLNKELTVPSDSDLLEKIRVFLNDGLGFAISSSKSMSDFEDAFSTDHLIDITCTWQLDHLGGMRLYCLGPGYSQDDLNIYEQYLVKRTEMLQSELEAKKGAL